VCVNCDLSKKGLLIIKIITIIQILMTYVVIINHILFYV